MRWADLLRTLQPSYVAPVLVYTLSMGEDVVEDLRDALPSHVSPESGGLVMSTAERLLQQGREQGMQQGRELGVSEGLSRSLQQLLQLKFTEVPEWALTRLANGQVEELERWTARVLAAETIEEIFAD